MESGHLGSCLLAQLLNLLPMFPENDGRKVPTKSVGGSCGVSHCKYLGCGFNYFLCSPQTLGKSSNLIDIFSDGLKPRPRYPTEN